MVGLTEVMRDLSLRPWRMWAPKTRETVLRLLEVETRKLEDEAESFNWATYPVTRTEIEDEIRALNDLWLAISERRPDPFEAVVSNGGVVPMGGEAAP